MDANWIVSETAPWQDSDSVLLWDGRSQNSGQRFDMKSDVALTESHISLSSKHDPQHPPSDNRIIGYSIYQRWERWSSKKSGKGNQKEDFSKYMHHTYTIPYPKKDYEDSLFNTPLWKKTQLNEGLLSPWSKYWYSSGDTTRFNNSGENQKVQSRFQEDWECDSVTYLTFYNTKASWCPISVHTEKSATLTSLTAWTGS